jgi:hypothetical protein
MVLVGRLLPACCRQFRIGLAAGPERHSPFSTPNFALLLGRNAEAWLFFNLLLSIFVLGV